MSAMALHIRVLGTMTTKCDACCACTEDELRADANPEERSWLAKALTSSGSSFAIAFLCTKALLPIRVPLTVAVTPVVARCADSLLAFVHTSTSHDEQGITVYFAPLHQPTLCHLRVNHALVPCRILQPRAVSEAARQAAREAAQQHSQKGA